MEPLCKEGDFILLDRLSYFVSRPKAGDMVILRHPWEDRLLLKYIRKEKEQEGKRWYWVEGLNAQESSDSRRFGWIEKNHIMGRAVVIRRKVDVS